jgi:hypothetical protein
MFDSLLTVSELAGRLAAAAPASSDAKPAGGAAVGEVVLATAGASLATGALIALGHAHRSGRVQLLRRTAERVARATGLPGWAALPSQVASAALIVALVGMYWDISLHIDVGRDAGPLANPAHYLILGGLFGLFTAGFLAVVLPDERPSRAAVRITEGWYAPVGGVILLACSSFSLIGFPLDDFWHRLFGQDVTLWGPTHLMLIGGAGLALLGHATLLVEGRTAGSEKVARRGGLAGHLMRSRYAAVMGGLLIGLSTFQAEFDFGVPQFQLVFQPLLIAFAAGVALVAARIYAGRGGAIVAVAYFLVIRGAVSLLVGPALGETTPHFPLYAVEALAVELVALRVAPERVYRFGALAGLAVGSAGLAAEWAWSHVWMPIAWPSSLLPEALVVVPLTGVAAGLIGGFVGGALGAARRPEAARTPALVPAAAALAVIAALVGYGLDTHTDSGTRATVALADLRPAPEREVSATVRLEPAGAARDARWLNVTSWQGGRLIVDDLERVGPGVYRTTQPIPVHGDWKSLIRLHTGDSIAGLPLYLPSDPAIPAPAVPAPARFSRAFVADRDILQRERADDVPAALPRIGYGVVLAIALSLILALAWALVRLARGSELTGRADAKPRAPARVTGAPA